MTISQRIQAMAFCEKLKKGDIIDIEVCLCAEFREQIKSYGLYIRREQRMQKHGHETFRVNELKKR